MFRLKYEVHVFLIMFKYLPIIKCKSREEFKSHRIGPDHRGTKDCRVRLRLYVKNTPRQNFPQIPLPDA